MTSTSGRPTPRADPRRPAPQGLGPAVGQHINGIEGFWSYAKHWLSPYRGVPTRYFHLSLAEVCYRYNHRDEDLAPLLTKLCIRRVQREDAERILAQFR